MTHPDTTPDEPRTATPSIIQCAVPAPLYAVLDYGAPKDGDCARLIPGTRVEVPLGRRQVIAVVTRVGTETTIEHEKLRSITHVIDETPLIDDIMLRLMQWVARYYLHPPGETVMLALSLRERRGEPPAPSGQSGFRLNLRGRGLPATALGRAPKQAQLLKHLQDGPKTVEQLAALGISRGIIRQLASKNLVEACDIKPKSQWRSHPGLEPSTEQAAAISAITIANQGFQCHVLHGVTGSGKTEVYLHCVAGAIERGQQALVLVPEIGLTPQMIERFKQRFEAPLAVLHSGLSDGERDRHWSMARDGVAAIVLGTRSAVFAPLKAPGIIIVDEEHDHSFQQQDGLRYSGRDVAIKRAQLHGCPVVLGSATPSLETLHNVTAGRFHYHALTTRAAGAAEPSKTIIDVRGLDLHGGLSVELRSAIQTTLAQGQQVLLFLNRRGFAPSLLCHDCGWVAECLSCDARLTLHRQPASLRCHHCDHRQHIPPTCPSCQSRRLVSSGLGTEQTEYVLQQYFPEIRIVRADSDSMSRRHAMSELGQTLQQGEPCIVVGTQLLTKGHHFPRVTLVGVIDADSLLLSPDFRGEERLLQLLTQVAGRAGRSTLAGQVFIQTRHPEHPIIASVLREPYRTTALTLLEQRERCALPPVGAMALMRCDSKRLGDGIQFLERIAKLCPTENCTIVGPLPAAMARRAGWYRCHLLVHGPVRTQVQQTAGKLLESALTFKVPAGLRWSMDIDPSETS